MSELNKSADKVYTMDKVSLTYDAFLMQNPLTDASPRI